MDTLPYLLLAAGVFVAFVILWRVFAKPSARPSLPFMNRSSLLTPAELRFYRMLLQALPPGVILCFKVRLMDVVSMPDGAWQQYGAQGSGMQLDFVLADPQTLAPLLAVELIAA